MMHPGEKIVDQLEVLESTSLPTIELSFEKWRHVTDYVRILEKYAADTCHRAQMAENNIMTMQAEIEGWGEKAGDE